MVIGGMTAIWAYDCLERNRVKDAKSKIGHVRTAISQAFADARVALDASPEEEVATGTAAQVAGLVRKIVAALRRDKILAKLEPRYSNPHRLEAAVHCALRRHEIAAEHDESCANDLIDKLRRNTIMAQYEPYRSYMRNSRESGNWRLKSNRGGSVRAAVVITTQRQQHRTSLAMHIKHIKRNLGRRRVQRALCGELE